MGCVVGRAAPMLLAAAIIAGCGGPDHSERPIEQAVPAQAEPESPILPALPAPAAREVEAKLRQIFGSSVRAEDRGGAVLTEGDFNGDGSRDLAVIVRPTDGSLAVLNDALANWIIKDARRVEPPDPRREVEPIQVAPRETLLAVIHGYGPAGWRNAEARQTYLLKNAAGEGLSVRPLDGLMPAPAGTRLAGDAITESVGGQPGFLFWNGARYIWRAL